MSVRSYRFTVRFSVLLVSLAAALIAVAVKPTDASAGEHDQRRRPLIVAHRGLLRHAPENTLPAFLACLELRLAFELDVRRTKDGWWCDRP